MHTPVRWLEYPMRKISAMIMMRSTGNELTHKRVNAIQGYDFKGAGAD
jgi:hypothetical protein